MIVFRIHKKRKEETNTSNSAKCFLVSYDVTALFTNVPLDETIHILADKAFKDNWFNKTYNMNISKDYLIDLLNVATKNSYFNLMATCTNKSMVSRWDHH